MGFAMRLAVMGFGSWMGLVAAACGGDATGGPDATFVSDVFIPSDVPVLVPDTGTGADVAEPDVSVDAELPDVRGPETSDDIAQDTSNSNDVDPVEPDAGDAGGTPDDVGDIGPWGTLVGGTWVVDPPGLVCDVFIPGSWTIDVAPGPRITALLGTLAAANCTVEEHDVDTGLLSLSCGTTVDATDGGTVGLGAYLVIQGDSALVELTVATRSAEAVVTCQDTANFTMTRTR
jgi:hypothetical protein